MMFEVAPLETESLIEGPVIEIKRNSVFVDLGHWGTGIIYGREFLNAKDIIKKIKVGDIVKALNDMGVTPSDIIAILQAAKVEGALQAEIVTM